MDDVRIVGGTEEECRRATRRVMSIAQSLGMQDASRKRINCNKGGNPCADSIVLASSDCLSVTVSAEKWLREKTILTKLLGHYLVEGSDAQVSFIHIKLEKD